MDIGTQLRRQRERAGLTQAALAARCGTSQTALSAYERGRKRPSLATLERLLAGCGARLAIQDARGPVLVPTPSEHTRTSRALADVLALANALPTRHARELRYPVLASRAA